MNTPNRLAAGLIAVLAAVVAACANQKDPAQQAVSKLDDNLAAIHDSAAKYDPDNLKTVEQQLATLKADLAKGDYQAVLNGAPGVNTAIAGLKQDSDTKQAAADAALAQTKQQWRTLSEEVPQMIAAIQAQLDTIDKSHRMPKGVSKSAYQTVKTDAAGLDPAWTEAVNAVTAEDYAGGVAKGQAVKDKATAVMQTLQIKPPAQS